MLRHLPFLLAAASLCLTACDFTSPTGHSDVSMNGEPPAVDGQDGTATEAGIDVGTEADSGSTTDSGATTDTGATTDSGATTEAGSITEAGTTTEAGSTIEAGSTTEAGTTTEAGATTVAGTTTEAGATTVAGTTTEPGADAKTGTAAEAGPDGGTQLSKLTESKPGSLMFNSDLEDQDASCWGNRNASGYARAACGEWGSIGSAGARLAVGTTSNSGSKSMQVTFGRDEEVGGASLALSADVVNVRAYYNFAEGFDFGQGVKIGRISSFNEATQKNDIDMVMTVRSSGSTSQCGLTDMSDMGMFFNGKPVGYDWGHAVAGSTRFQRGRWYAIEYQVKLNSPGRSDGWVKIWVDGQPAASKEGIDIRGTGGAGVKLNRIRVGGWYSNGANKNACKNPSEASTMFIDDVAVGSDFIGTR